MYTILVVIVKATFTLTGNKVVDAYRRQSTSVFREKPAERQIPIGWDARLRTIVRRCRL